MTDIALEIPDISKGRGRPTAASKGKQAKRQYTRTVTAEMLAMRRIGEALYGRNWQVDFAAAVKYDKGLITRILSGTRHMPEDMPKRVNKALEKRINGLSKAAALKLLNNDHIDAGNNAEALVRLGETIWGTYWRRDMASVCEVDPGLMTNGLKGRRPVTLSGPKIKAAILAKIAGLTELLDDDFFKPKAEPETVQSA